MSLVSVRPESTTGSSYDSLFASAGAKYGVSPALLASVAKAESGFNPNAVFSRGAEGLMLLMPKTARALGVQNSFDPGSPRTTRVPSWSIKSCYETALRALAIS